MLTRVYRADLPEQSRNLPVTTIPGLEIDVLMASDTISPVHFEASLIGLNLGGKKAPQFSLLNLEEATRIKASRIIPETSDDVAGGGRRSRRDLAFEALIGEGHLVKENGKKKATTLGRRETGRLQIFLFPDIINKDKGPCRGVLKLGASKHGWLLLHGCDGATTAQQVEAKIPTLTLTLILTLTLTHMVTLTISRLY